MFRNTSSRLISGLAIPSFRRISALLLFLFMCAHAHNAAAQEINFHNEASDTTRITKILIDECNHPDRGNAARLARLFIDTPYIGGTLEGDSIETLRVNIDEFDCTTFVETVAALAITAGERRQSWHDFAYNLRRLRYRNGETDGYASRLHYISDWIVDNTHKGIITDVTARIANPASQIKSLDFMTSNRDKYPALKDSATFEQMKKAEMGYRSHKIPYIKTIGIKEANLKTGDIVAITTDIKNLDVTHIGIVVFRDGKPHLLHASSKAGKVLIDPLPLENYVRRNKHNTGIRVIRMKE